MANLAGARELDVKDFGVLDVAVWPFLWSNDVDDVALTKYPLSLVVLSQLGALGGIVVGEEGTIKLNLSLIHI